MESVQFELLQAPIYTPHPPPSPHITRLYNYLLSLSTLSKKSLSTLSPNTFITKVSLCETYLRLITTFSTQRYRN